MTNQDALLKLQKEAGVGLGAVIVPGLVDYKPSKSRKCWQGDVRILCNRDPKGIVVAVVFAKSQKELHARKRLVAQALGSRLWDAEDEYLESSK